MELREFALGILSRPSLEAKLAPLEGELTDDAPGPAVFWETPARPPELQIRTKKTRPRMPSEKALGDPKKRGLALHFFANHELQALEIMAFAILAYPGAPPAFRRGLLGTLRDEQRHLALYLERMAALGVRFGEIPVNDYFWSKTRALATPLHYLATLPLTFEGGNLDRAPRYEALFRAVGDEESAALMRRIFEDEIGHVRFGATWLRRLKDPSRSDFDVFAEHLAWPLRPAKARGPTFCREARLAAGLDPDFVERLERAVE